MAWFLAPLIARGQDDTKTQFPLEKFYVDRGKHNLRHLLRNFRFGLTTGYGNTFFNHNLKGYAVYQVHGKAPEIFNGKSSPSVRFSNWVNKATADSSAVNGGAYRVNSDTTKIGFKGHALNIPLKLTIHYEFKRFRIGAGYAYEWMNIGSLHPTGGASDSIRNFKPAASSGFMKKYFGVLGVSFFRKDNYLFTADVNIGGFKPGSNFNSGQIKKGLYYNLGITAERELSEYLKLVVRPSFDYKNYTLNVPGGPAIAHHINAFYVNIGVSYTIPELPRCFKRECKVQINHAHGNKEYRSRVQPFYKKQNPGYGENNPLIKYKGSNKKKMNPY